MIKLGIIKDGKYVQLSSKIESKGIGRINVHIFPDGLWREMSYKGEEISSKRQLKEECYKRGMISPYFDINPRRSGYEEEREEVSRKAKEKRNQEKTAKSDNH